MSGVAETVCIATLDVEAYTIVDTPYAVVDVGLIDEYGAAADVFTVYAIADVLYPGVVYGLNEEDGVTGEVFTARPVKREYYCNSHISCRK